MVVPSNKSIDNSIYIDKGWPLDISEHNRGETQNITTLHTKNNNNNINNNRYYSNNFSIDNSIYIDKRLASKYQ